MILSNLNFAHNPACVVSRFTIDDDDFMRDPINGKVQELSERVADVPRLVSNWHNNADSYNLARHRRAALWQYCGHDS